MKKKLDEMEVMKNGKFEKSGNKKQMIVKIEG